MSQATVRSYEQRRKSPVLAPAGSNEPPRRPKSVAELGVRRVVLEDVALKSLHLFGPFSPVDLSCHMRIGLTVADELARRLCTEQLCEMGGARDKSPEITISSQGRSHALELLSISQYADVAPVSLGSYVEQIRRQSVRNIEVHPRDLERAFADVVLDSRTLWQLGTALSSGSSVFLHGPSGTGKTMIAETLARVVAADAVWIPYSLEVNGKVISIYDPMIHRAVADAPSFDDADQRWILCHRPFVTVGGELTMEMLELQFDRYAGFYEAPIQMKANNGVLIIDDLGRQRVRAEELLSRWITPLERRSDFLSLTSGKRFEIPLETLVVFATNVDPAKLLDPAFLRRIRTKIKLGTISDEQFVEVFRREASDHGLECDAVVLTDLIDAIRGKLHQALRPSFPREIVNQVCWAARYEGNEPMLDHSSVSKALENYFLTKS